MDWDKAIERNEQALTLIVSALFALLVSARLAGVGLMVPRRVWRMVLFVLRPAEAAVRRLIILAARGLAPISSSPRGPASRSTFSAIPQNPVPLAPAFNLFDPLKTYPFGHDDGGELSASFDEAAPDNTPINANSLQLRLRALRHALSDLSKQAKRLARFNARRDAALKARKPTRISLMRPGLPPGWRERPRHEVDSVLRECHRMAQHLADTS